jgi:hypothetical protein
MTNIILSAIGGTLIGYCLGWVIGRSKGYSPLAIEFFESQPERWGYVGVGKEPSGDPPES